MPKSKGNVDNKTSSKKELSSEWTIQWFDNATETQKKNWKLGKPMFKYCKKRKEFFSEDFFDVWYKSPYKYHMLLRAKDLGDENVSASLDVTYEDGQKINSKEECISKTENTFVCLSENEYEVKLGSFQFNVCSYKHDGRKFRLVVHLNVGDEKPVCAMISTGFVIKAKKPISKPGIKTKKRKRQEEEMHQAKYMAIPQQFAMKRQKFEMMQNPMAHTMIKSEAPMYGLPYVNMQPLPPQIQQPITGTFDILENLRSNTEMDVVDGFPMTQLELDECYQHFENPLVYPQEQVSRHANVKPQVAEASLYKVNSVLSAFETMSEKERKQTICRLIEKCHEYEREFLNRKYFSSVPSTPIMPQQFQMQQVPYFDGIQTTNVAQYFT